MGYDGTERRHDPAALTEEQLAWISDQTEHAARKALHRYRASSIAAFLVLLAANIFVWTTGNSQNDDARKAIVQSGKVVSVAGCNRDFRSTQALRGVLTTADKLQEDAIKKGEIQVSPKQRALAHKFYTDQLKKLPLPDCKAAGEILTSDPNEASKVPKPLTP